MHIFLCVSECAVCVFLLTYLNLSHVYVLLELAFTFVADVIEGQFVLSFYSLIKCIFVTSELFIPELLSFYSQNFFFFFLLNRQINLVCQLSMFRQNAKS